jgi:predicted nucleic-acid-binding protein
MIAIDTNIIIRYLVEDHLEQTARSRQIIDEQDVFVSVTVVQEVEWVLRSIYRFRRQEVINAFLTFAGMPSVTIEDSDLVAQALDLFSHGMDFADALHLLKAQHCEKFVTFDRQMIKAAQAAGHQFVQDA